MSAARSALLRDSPRCRPARAGTGRAGRRGLLAEVLRDAAAPASIVDVGCGDGAATILAAQVNPGHRIVGA